VVGPVAVVSSVRRRMSANAAPKCCSLAGPAAEMTRSASGVARPGTARPAGVEATSG
jgi:hypothetical protein